MPKLTWMLCAAALFAAAPASAQDTYDMAKAKSEGTVVWYTSTPVATGQKISNMFKEKTGITVDMFRSGGSAVLRRFQQEIDGGRVAVDVLTHSSPAAALAMVKKGTLVPFKPKGFDKIPAEVKDPNGAYIAQRLNIVTLYVRTDKIAAGDIPKTWRDALDPKFKSKMVMPDPSFTSLFVSVDGTLSKMYGWDFFEKLRKNDVMIVQSNQQVSDMLKRNERFLALGSDSYAYDLRKQGHPIKTLYPSDGVFVIASPTAVIKGSPHPNAAKAFAEFMISPEVQKQFPAFGNFAARTDVAPPEGAPGLDTIKIIPVDYDYIKNQTAAIKKKFNEVFQ
jgi:iron(III) transport system substrate-binding protein